MLENLPFNLSNPGIALAVFGYFGFIVKDLPMNLWSFIKQKMSSTIQAASVDVHVHEITMNWLMQKFSGLDQHINFSDRIHMFHKEALTNIANGSYTFFLDAFTYAIVTKEMNRSGEERNGWLLTCRIIGLNRKKYIQDYKEAVKRATPNESNFMYISYSENNIHNFCFCRKKKFEDVFISKEIKNRIISIIDNFLHAREYYEKHGITYKMGILLSGAPGSGKTVLSKAIASYVGWSLCFIGANSNLSLNYENSVILLEDIDTIIEKSREDKKSDSKPTDFSLEKKKISMHDLLNYIDGVKSPNNCIFIATTNYPERLDPALIRPGRFDYHFRIDYADRELAMEMCDRYEVEYDVLDEFEFPCSLAQVQNRIIQKKIDG